MEVDSPKPVSGSNGPVETELWVDKYKPTSCKAIIGQQGKFILHLLYDRERKIIVVAFLFLLIMKRYQK